MRRKSTSTHCPLSLPRQKVQAVYKSPLNSKQSSNEPFLEHFLTIGGYLEHYMYHITVLGWLKKERKKERRKRKKERKKWLSNISGLKKLLHIAITTADCGKLYKLAGALCTCSPVIWYHRVNANTLIGATILFLGHPYTIMDYANYGHESIMYM